MVEISKFDHFGNGISRSNELVLFVDRALPGEVIEEEIIENKKHFNRGKISKVLKENSNRVEPICPFYNLCGGCNFLHCKKELENEFKIAKCEELFKIKPLLHETKEYNYRNKVTLHVNGNKLGFYQENSNDIIDINYCYLLDDKINIILGKISDYIHQNKVKFDEIVIRASNDETMIAIKGIVEKKFIDYCQFVNHIIINNKVIKGNGYLNMSILNYQFKINSDSFFQVNNQGLCEIFDILKKYIHKCNFALDLYGGTGVMGILLSSYAKKVVSIESNLSSSNNAITNKEVNNIDNMEIINGKVEDYINKFIDADLIIIDPPRSGLDSKTISYFHKIKAETIVYISCNMDTLKSDLNFLNDKYDVVAIELVDMFPKTYHVECVSVLHRK